MANPQVLVQLSKNFLTRNNPLDLLFKQVMQAVDTVLNFQSQIKLMKFRYMLYRQQMQSIEKNLMAGAVAPRGSKVDRRY